MNNVILWYNMFGDFMKRPIIGVIARPYITDNNRQVLCILENVRRNILRFGGIPLSILPTQDIIKNQNLH